MSKKAKVEIIETTNKNVKVGDEFKVNISAEKGTRTGGNRRTIGGGERKPKKPRMTINQLATIVEKQGTKLDQLGGTVNQLAGTVNQLAGTVNNLALEMRAGFAVVNQRIDGLDKRIDKLEENDEKIFDILARNNLK